MPAGAGTDVFIADTEKGQQIPGVPGVGATFDADGQMPIRPFAWGKGVGQGIAMPVSPSYAWRRLVAYTSGEHMCG